MRVNVSIVWFALIACVLVRTGGPDTLILCFGTDGHVALEYARDGTCFARTSGPSASVLSVPVLTEPSPLRSACSKCFDIPIALNGPHQHFRPVEKTAPQIETPMIAAAYAGAPKSPGTSISDRYGLPPPWAGTPLVLLRTVVMLR